MAQENVCARSGSLLLIVILAMLDTTTFLNAKLVIVISMEQEGKFVKWEVGNVHVTKILLGKTVIVVRKDSMISLIAQASEVIFI